MELSEQLGIVTKRVNDQERVITNLTNAVEALNEVVSNCRSTTSTHQKDCQEVLDFLVPAELVGDSEKEKAQS